MRQGVIIVISFLIAFILTIFPLPEWAEWLRPPWVLLVLVYWTLAEPQRIGFFTAWVVGLIVDVLTGTLLGEHALVFVLATYFILRFHARIKHFYFWQQSVVVFMLVFFNQLILFWVQGMINQLPSSGLYWLASLASLIAWPIVIFLLSRAQRRSTQLNSPFEVL